MGCKLFGCEAEPEQEEAEAEQEEAFSETLAQRNEQCAKIIRTNREPHQPFFVYSQSRKFDRYYRKIKIVGGRAIGLIAAIKLDDELRSNSMYRPITIYEKRPEQEKRAHVIALDDKMLGFLDQEICVEALKYGWFQDFMVDGHPLFLISYKQFTKALTNVIKQRQKLQRTNIEKIEYNKEIRPEDIKDDTGTIVIAADGPFSPFGSARLRQIESQKYSQSRPEPDSWAAMTTFKFKNEDCGDDLRSFPSDTAIYYFALNQSPQENTRTHNVCFQLIRDEYQRLVGTFSDRTNWKDLPPKFKHRFEYSLQFKTHQEFLNCINFESIEFWKYEITLNHSPMYAHYDSQKHILHFEVGDAAFTNHNFAGRGIQNGIFHVRYMLRALAMDNLKEFETSMTLLQESEHATQRKLIDMFNNVVDHCNAQHKDEPKKIEHCLMFSKFDGAKYTVEEPKYLYEFDAEAAMRRLLSAQCPIEDEPNLKLAMLILGVFTTLIVGVIVICLKRLRASFTRSSA